MGGGEMMIRIIFAFFVVGAVSGIAHADDMVPCPNGRYIPDRMVPNKQVAEAIYRAVGQNLVPANFNEYPIVVVEDAGDHWSVSQTSGKPVPKPIPGTVVVSAGGGQLNMDIDKCTAAISHAALNK
jgi:hypothetical protein